MLIKDLYKISIYLSLDFEKRQDLIIKLNFLS